MRASMLSLSLIILAGCSGPSLDGDDRFTGEDADPDADSGTPDDDDLDGERPSYWAVGGTLMVANGVVVADGSDLNVRFFDEGAAPWSIEGSATCGFQVAEVVPGPEREPDAPELAAWWTLALRDSDEGQPCSWALPVIEATGGVDTPTLVLGFGPVTAALGPPMLAAGLDPDLPVYGLYGLLPNGRGEAEYVYGVAGTDDQLAGDAPPPDLSAAEDGAYRVRTLALLPLPSVGAR